jgi:hypothetical protein
VNRNDRVLAWTIIALVLSLEAIFLVPAEAWKHGVSSGGGGGGAVATLIVGNTPGGDPAEDETVRGGTGNLFHAIGAFDHARYEIIEQGNTTPVTVAAGQGRRSWIDSVRFCSDGNCVTVTTPTKSPVTGLWGYSILPTTVGGAAADGLHYLDAYVRPHEGIEHHLKPLPLVFNTNSGLTKHQWYVDYTHGNNTWNGTTNYTGCTPNCGVGSNGPYKNILYIMSHAATTYHGALDLNVINMAKGETYIEDNDGPTTVATILPIFVQQDASTVGTQPLISQTCRCRVSGSNAGGTFVFPVGIMTFDNIGLDMGQFLFFKAGPVDPDGGQDMLLQDNSCACGTAGPQGSPDGWTDGNNTPFTSGTGIKAAFVNSKCISIVCSSLYLARNSYFRVGWDMINIDGGNLSTNAFYGGNDFAAEGVYKGRLFQPVSSYVNATSATYTSDVAVSAYSWNTGAGGTIYLQVASTATFRASGNSGVPFYKLTNLPTIGGVNFNGSQLGNTTSGALCPTGSGVCLVFIGTGVSGSGSSGTCSGCLANPNETTFTIPNLVTVQPTTLTESFTGTSSGTSTFTATWAGNNPATDFGLYPAAIASLCLYSTGIAAYDGKCATIVSMTSNSLIFKIAIASGGDPGQPTPGVWSLADYYVGPAARDNDWLEDRSGLNMPSVSSVTWSNASGGQAVVHASGTLPDSVQPGNYMQLNGADQAAFNYEFRVLAVDRVANTVTLGMPENPSVGTATGSITAYPSTPEWGTSNVTPGGHTIKVTGDLTDLNGRSNLFFWSVAHTDAFQFFIVASTGQLLGFQPHDIVIQQNVFRNNGQSIQGGVIQGASTTSGSTTNPIVGNASFVSGSANVTLQTPRNIPRGYCIAVLPASSDATLRYESRPIVTDVLTAGQAITQATWDPVALVETVKFGGTLPIQDGDQILFTGGAGAWASTVSIFGTNGKGTVSFQFSALSDPGSAAGVTFGDPNGGTIAVTNAAWSDTDANEANWSLITGYTNVMILGNVLIGPSIGGDFHQFQTCGGNWVVAQNTFTSSWDIRNAAGYGAGDVLFADNIFDGTANSTWNGASLTTDSIFSDKDPGTLVPPFPTAALGFNMDTNLIATVTGGRTRGTNMTVNGATIAFDGATQWVSTFTPQISVPTLVGIQNGSLPNNAPFIGVDPNGHTISAGNGVGAIFK